MLDKNIIKDAVAYMIRCKGVDPIEIRRETGLTKEEIIKFITSRANGEIYRYIPVKLYAWLKRDDEVIRNMARAYRQIQVGGAIMRLFELCDTDEEIEEAKEYVEMYADEIKTLRKCEA